MLHRRGFPNAALNGRTEYGLDLNKLVLKNPASTYFMQIDSDEYDSLGLQAGDYVAIDRSLEPKPSDLIVYHADGEFRLSRVDSLDGTIELWGVIAWVIHPNRTK